MSSTREQLVAKVEARMELITVAGGYRTDIGHQVRSWQASAPRWDELPMLRVTDPEDQMGAAIYGKTPHTLSVAIELMLPGGAAPATLRDCAADILQAIGVDPTWDDLASATRAIQANLDPGIVNEVSAGLAVGLEIEFETALWET